MSDQKKYLKYKLKYLELKNNTELKDNSTISNPSMSNPSMSSFLGGSIVSKKTSKQDFSVKKKIFDKEVINIKTKKGGKKNKYIIGIAGASGCGKTYFSNYIKKQLEKDFLVEIISCDDYYKRNKV